MSSRTVVLYVISVPLAGNIYGLAIPPPDECVRGLLLAGGALVACGVVQAQPRAGMRGGVCCWRAGIRSVGVLCVTRTRPEKQGALFLPLRLQAILQLLLPRYICRC